METPEEILAKLMSRDFDSLLGLAESVWLEAKESPYALDVPKQRRELTKDVTALANAEGGIILIGFDTDRHPTTAAETIGRVSKFPLDLINPDQYMKILGATVHPPLHAVDVHLFEGGVGDGKGVAAIVIHRSATADGPYLVGNMVDESGQSLGAYFGFFERKRDVIPPISVARIQQQLAAGQQWTSVQERLEAIEQHLRSWNAPPPLTVAGVTREERERRLKEARVAVGRDDAPLVYLLASAEGACDFPTLFRSPVERIVQLIEEPPQLRRNGFEVWADKRSTIVKGEARRNLFASDRLIELWKDGLFVFVGPGDEGLLGWRIGPSDGRPILVHNFALSELILHFCWLVRWIFAEASPMASTIRIEVGFDNLTRPAGPARMLDAAHGRNAIGGHVNDAPDSKGAFHLLAEWDGYNPARVTYLLVEKIYHWFGFESQHIPYVDTDGPTPIISAKVLTEKPLPTDPPQTRRYA
jgi:hypothetical protein